MSDICEVFASYRNAGKVDTSMDGRGLPIPNRWLHCPRKSSIIADIFIVCKTMLDGRYDSQVAEEHRFNWKMLSNSVQSSYKRRIGLVIDLTNTDRFYDKKEIENSGVRYIKLGCRGHGECPTPKAVNEFIMEVQSFMSEFPQHIVCVHCTHGFNRSGFMVASFLCNVMNWDLETAIKTFSQCRSPGIYKPDYLSEISKLYGNGDEDIVAPELPEWHKEYDDSEAPKRGKSVKLKETKFMDGMISNVDNVMDVKLVQEIQSTVSKICEWKGKGFPGAQPVSMDRENIERLTKHNYGVTWKADGQRYLMLIRGRGEIYMLDRDFAVYKVNDMIFPRRENLHEHIIDTLLDGEMIIDNYQDCKRGRYLVYDIVRFEGKEVCKTIFNTRLKCMSKEIVEPRNLLFMKGGLDKNREPFSIRAKEFWDLTKAKKILDGDFSKQLLHEIDGLIFQPFDDTYEFGQCKAMLKWKPPELNSVDFRLVIERESGEGLLNQLIGKLMVGGLKVPFASIKVTKQLMQYNNKIIECSFENNTWKFMRERTDKSFPNKFETAQAVMNSIKNPVTKEILYRVIDTQRFDLIRMRQRNNGGGHNHGNTPNSVHNRPPSGGSSSSSSSHCSSASMSHKRTRDTDPLGLCSDIPVDQHSNDRHNVPITYQYPVRPEDPLGLQSNDDVHHLHPNKKARRY